MRDRAGTWLPVVLGPLRLQQCTMYHFNGKTGTTGVMKNSNPSEVTDLLRLHQSRSCHFNKHTCDTQAQNHETGFGDKHGHGSDTVNQNGQQVETAAGLDKLQHDWPLRRPFRGVRGSWVVPSLRRPASRIRAWWRPLAFSSTMSSCSAHPREGNPRRPSKT